MLFRSADGNVTHYGRLLQLDGETNAVRGSVDIDLSRVDMSNQTLYIFNEQYNGTQMVDYSSPLTEPNAFTITFDANGGNVTPAYVKTVEGKLVELPTCNRSGYRFAGWYTAADDGTQITENSIFIEDTTLYAHWDYIGSSSSTTTTTVKNEDGSTTTTTTNTVTGTVTETTKYTDGSTVTVETKKDGTATTTDKAANGVTTVTKTDKDSVATSATVTVPSSVKDPVEVHVPTNLGKADGKVSVEVTYKDGTKETVTGTYSDGKVSLSVSGSASIKILDDFVPLATALPFADVPADAWYYDELLYAYNYGLFAGTSATTFSPTANMTRQQMWMVLSRMAGETPANMDEAQAWAVKNNISDGSNPTNNVTREQFVTLLWRFAGSPTSDGTMGLAGYDDATAIADYAHEAMLWAVKNQIISGTSNTTLDPEGNATRAQVAVILARFKQQ